MWYTFAVQSWMNSCFRFGFILVKAATCGGAGLIFEGARLKQTSALTMIMSIAKQQTKKSGINLPK
jgi:hypothetical protein